MGTGLAIDPATSYYYSINLGIAVRDSILTAMKYLEDFSATLAGPCARRRNSTAAGPCDHGLPPDQGPAVAGRNRRSRKGNRDASARQSSSFRLSAEPDLSCRASGKPTRTKDSALEIAKAAADSLRAGSWDQAPGLDSRPERSSEPDWQPGCCGRKILSGLDSGSTAPTGTDAANQAGGNSGLSPSVP